MDNEQQRAAGTPAPDCSPVRVAYSREEMIERARIWMRKNYPVENTAESANAWMARFGLMVDFITDMFPANTK